MPGPTVLCYEVRPHQSSSKASLTTHHGNTPSVSDASSSLDKGSSQLYILAIVLTGPHICLTLLSIKTDNHRSTTHPTKYIRSTPQSQAQTTSSSKSELRATAIQITKSMKASISPKLRSPPAMSPWAPSLPWDPKSTAGRSVTASEPYCSDTLAERVQSVSER
jgi:hypothetical protein